MVPPVPRLFVACFCVEFVCSRVLWSILISSLPSWSFALAVRTMFLSFVIATLTSTNTPKLESRRVFLLRAAVRPWGGSLRLGAYVVFSHVTRQLHASTLLTVGFFPLRKPLK